jgi:hypothetical protein
VSESPIAAYLAQLDRELRVNRAPRRRLLAEAEDHLRASAHEVAAAGVSRVETEEQAVERFGAAALVARRFAHAVASTSARASLICAAAACTSYAFAAGFFIFAAPVWMRDFPQGAPSMIALQVAFVALVLTGLRALRFRGRLLIDELRVRLIAHGAAIATSVVALAAAVELVLALTRPANAPWGDAADVIAIYLVAAGVVFAAAAFAVATVARTQALATLPRPREHGLPEAVKSLVDDVAATAPALEPAVALATSRPALTCAVTAAAAFLAMAVVGVSGEGSALAGASAAGLFEAAAVVAAYLTLGRALGLRAPRRSAAG